MKFELVFIPLNLSGHLKSMVEMAKLLVDRDDRLFVTVIIIPPQFGDDRSSSNILSSVSNQRLRHTFLPRADQPSDQEEALYIESYKQHVRAAVAENVDPTLSDSPRLAGFVLDMFCTAMIDVADELSVPAYMFYTSNAGFLGLSFYVQFLSDEKKYDVTELKDSDAEFDVPFLTRPLPAKCTPSVMVNKEWLPFLLNMATRFRETKGILVNSFAELEPQAMKSLSGGDTPPVYAVGPILDLKTEGQNSTDEKRSEILRWLDEQPPRSVVFLCFGSVGGFSEEQAREIAVALERSGHRFLWSLRRARPMGTTELPGEFTNLEEVLPEGFLDRTAEIGKIIGWAPQTAVLANPAIGGFVSHCGWNSTLESLWLGVPTATWPLYAEQRLNAFMMVKELGLAVEIRMDIRGDILMGDMELVTAEEIERGIRCLMEHDSNVRKRVKEMSEKGHVALMEGGSSYAALGKFIQDVLANVP